MRRCHIKYIKYKIHRPNFYRGVKAWQSTYRSSTDICSNFIFTKNDRLIKIFDHDTLKWYIYDIS